MKKEIVLTVVLMSLLGSKSIESKEDTFYNIGFTIYNGVENYYYSYLEYPKSIDILAAYLWEQRINRANNFQFSSFEEFLTSKDSDKVRNTDVENTIDFLYKNRQKISISIVDNHFLFAYRKKHLIKMDYDYCRDKMTPWDNKFSRHYFHTYDSIGKITRGDYVERFDSIQRRLLINFPKVCITIDNEGDTIVNYSLVRYGRNRHISSICLDDTVQIYDSPYMKAMTTALDSLIGSDKDIYSIMFLAALRY